MNGILKKWRNFQKKGSDEMSEKYAEIDGLTIEELVIRHDEKCDGFPSTPEYYQEVIFRKIIQKSIAESEMQTKEMNKITLQIKNMTFWIMLLTILNVIFVGIQITKLFE